MRVAIVGAGAVGSGVARLLIAHGHDVVLSASRPPADLATLVAELGAEAAPIADALASADLVVLATPFSALATLPTSGLRGRLVIDATTYYRDRDGDIPALLAGELTPGEYAQTTLHGALLVRAFTHVSAADIPRDGMPHGTPGRRALALSSDHPDALTRVAGILDDLGYDTVDAGPLSESWRYDPLTPASGVRLDATALRAELAAAVRVTRPERSMHGA